MKVQSLSILVPGGCANRCHFCVAKLHPGDEYINQIERNRRFRDLYRKDYCQRMAYARDNGCDVMVLTGDGEPLMNMNFLEDVAQWNRQLPSPFKNTAIQTSGVGLTDEKLRWLRNEIEVKTISLSVSSLDSIHNAEYNDTPKNLVVDLNSMCKAIKKYDFNLRLSINLTNWFDNYSYFDILTWAERLGADQITFRVLYKLSIELDEHGSEADSKRQINEWIGVHKTSDYWVNGLHKYIIKNGRTLERLPFGAIRYSIRGMSVVVDDNCMSSIDIGKPDESIKYLILRPNCKLYTRWDDKGSLLF
jgi:molybdenum cofactor biosynthesis enzyme MoaA